MTIVFTIFVPNLNIDNMEANELMIGDWVSMRLPNGKHIANDQLMSVDAVKEGRLIVNPIPLTEEILKANGWTSVPDYSMPFEDGQQEITDYHWSPNFNSYPLVLLQMADDSGMFKVFNGVTIYYVHELQHALRLVGLSELADNFVVE